MNARTLFAGMLTSGVILGVGVGLGTAAQHGAVISVPSTGVTGTGTTTSGGTTGGTSTGSTGSGSSASGSGSSAADGTYTGDSVPTRFGDVQVQVTVSGGQITDVTPLRLTDRDGRSVQISNRAAPILREEVLSAQSANVRMVSGATYTSEGYLNSLQSALDQAGL
ncbi:MAG: FMN-binding protein [Microbacteriaceae bacterium]